ncbi:hypothetical protein ASF36_24990 [Methylobacterium sp. Leaf90]|nr:hypothetical protein ASF36_24990 [Methylobacterium sp. Leaf90]
MPDEGWLEGSRIDGRSLAVLLRRGWIRRVHLDPRGQPRRDGYQRTAAARAVLFPNGQPQT